MRRTVLETEDRALANSLCWFLKGLELTAGPILPETGEGGVSVDGDALESLFGAADELTRESVLDTLCEWFRSGYQSRRSLAARQSAEPAPPDWSGSQAEGDDAQAVYAGDREAALELLCARRPGIVYFKGWAVRWTGWKLGPPPDGAGDRAWLDRYYESFGGNSEFGEESADFQAVPRTAAGQYIAVPAPGVKRASFAIQAASGSEPQDFIKGKPFDADGRLPVLYSTPVEEMQTMRKVAASKLLRRLEQEAAP